MGSTSLLIAYGNVADLKIYIKKKKVNAEKVGFLELPDKIGQVEFELELGKQSGPSDKALWLSKLNHLQMNSSNKHLRYAEPLGLVWKLNPILPFIFIC